MHKHRGMLLIGVLLVAFTLVGTSLAAANQARQTEILAGFPKTILNSSSTPQVRHPYQPAGYIPSNPPIPTASKNHPYTPSLPAHPTSGWQPLQDGPTSSRSSSPESDFGDWDSNHVFAPTILEESDTLYMWYSGIDWNGSVAIGLATSLDGITWTKSIANPFFSNAAEGSILELALDDMRLYYSDVTDGSIDVSISTDGGSTWSAGVPVLTPTHQTGDWDMDWISDPIVYHDGIGTYYMFYEGGTIDSQNGLVNSAQIGLATSSDGLVWTRYQADPVLSPTPGEWDDQWVLDPMVIAEGTEWKMWYRGLNMDGTRAIGYATSSDGAAWTKYAGNPVFSSAPGEWDDGGPSNMWVRQDVGYQMWYYANRQIGYATSDDGIVWTRPLDDAVLKPTPLLYLELNYGHDWAHIYTLPNETITVTLEDAEHNYKGTITGQANTWGDFWSSDWPWDTGWQDFQAFDNVYVEAAGLSEQVEPVGEIQGVMDVDADTVVGSLNAPWFTEAQMNCELWSDPWINIDLGMVLGDGGTFLCDYGAVGVDLQPGMQVAPVYFEPDGDKVINVIETPWMRVNYAHEWVGGNYPAGHTFNITLMDSAGNVKATAITQSEPGRGWGGDGFETYWEQWTPREHDIQPSDKVIFESDDGFYDEVLVGDIQGNLDIDLDMVSGPVYANWYTDDLNIECHPWGSPPGTQAKYSTAGPDGDPPFTCDWSGEWDILPGQDLAVMYIEPDTANRVINVFRDPAPNMSISKWAEGNAQFLPGGPVQYNIWVANHGDGTAETFRITDTLPANTSYLTDTSGVPVTIGTGWLTWDFGPTDPGEWYQFRVVLLNSAMPGDVLTNVVEVTASYDFDDGNDHAWAEAYIGEGNYNLYANKYAPVGDPLPGDTYVYHVNTGNQDAFASGQVILTETLPEGTSLVSWESWNNYDLWEQVSYADGQLVLRAATLPGYWGDTIRLRLLVDEGLPEGTQLTNTVEVTTPNDVDPWNNWYQDIWVWTGSPRVDGRIVKDMPWGSIVPGGELVYPIRFSNDGNTTFDALITDTLPAGMSFIASPAWRYGNEFTFDPVYVDDQVVVWNYADLPPGEWIDVDLRLAIDPEFEPGTTATNCIEINSGGDDGSPWNNTDCAATLVQDLGPNLRLTKYYWWNWEGQLQYQLDIQNIGSESLEDIVVTDTYPLSTTFNGNIWWDGPWITMTSNLTDHQLIFWVDYMDPGGNAKINFQVDLDSEIIYEKGLMFTNLAEAPLNGDVNPADNTAEVTAYTGADVYIEKWLSGGTPLPGEILTFTVEFGNLNNGPWTGDPGWGSHITDTLPEGMTFITATAPWNATQFWTPESQDGGVLRWGWGTMWANSLWRFDIVVQLAEDLKDGDVLTNFVEAYGDNPEDFDFDWTNNFSELDIFIDIPPELTFLPMVYK